MYVGLLVKCVLFLSGFNDTSTFSTDFRKILICQISRKSAEREPSCSYGRKGRQASMTKVTVAFRKFSSATKYGSYNTGFNVLH